MCWCLCERERKRERETCSVFHQYVYVFHAYVVHFLCVWCCMFMSGECVGTCVSDMFVKCVSPGLHDVSELFYTCVSY